VQTLQTRLSVWGAKLTVDGNSGPLTLAAVKALQTRAEADRRRDRRPADLGCAQQESRRDISGADRAGGGQGSVQAQRQAPAAASAQPNIPGLPTWRLRQPDRPGVH